MEFISLFVLLLFSPQAKPSAAPRQEQSTQLAQLFIYADSVSADGVWRADNLNEKTELAFDAVTHLECHKHGGMDLVGTDAYCAQMTATVAFGVPDVDVAYFPVIIWSTDKIIAADSATARFPICTWTQITINLQDHSIMATDTRKLGKGHKGFNNSCEEAPLTQTYHLMDKDEELLRRRMRAAKLAEQKK